MLHTHNTCRNWAWMEISYVFLQCTMGYWHCINWSWKQMQLSPKLEDTLFIHGQLAMNSLNVWRRDSKMIYQLWNFQIQEYYKPLYIWGLQNCFNIIDRNFNWYTFKFKKLHEEIVPVWITPKVWDLHVVNNQRACKHFSHEDFRFF